MNELKVKAYAKINLFLEICGRRENGYHEIDTMDSLFPEEGAVPSCTMSFSLEKLS